MVIQENTKKTLNFVYDSWVLDIPTHNIGEVLGDGDFRDEYGFFDFYQRFFQAQLGYSREIFSVNKCRISDVYENPNQKYYYGIKTALGLSDIFREREVQLSESIIKCLQECDNIKILYIREHEPETILDFDAVTFYLDKNNIPHNKLIIISNNPKIDEYKNNKQSDIGFHRTNLLQITSTSVWNELGSDLVVDKKGSFFCCFNKSPKRHRIATLISLQDNQILGDTNWSMLVDYRMGRGFDLDDIRHDFEDYLGDISDKHEVIDSILCSGDRKSEFESNTVNIVNGGFEKPDIEIEGAGGEAGGVMVPESKQSNENSYVSIITESYFDNHWDAIHVTEKSLRPFFYYQLPIIMATKGHIKFMEEEFGLDFYRDLIDHSYNDCESETERFQKAIQEIKRLQENKEQVIEYYKNNTDRLEKNKSIVSNFPNDDTDLKYFIFDL